MSINEGCVHHLSAEPGASLPFKKNVATLQKRSCSKIKIRMQQVIIWLQKNIKEQEQKEVATS